MPHLAQELASWAVTLDPSPDDVKLAEHALKDTVAVALAARGHAMERISAGLPEAARWAALGHVLDFDDLHLPSTAHISVVCVPAVLAAGGGAREYLAAAGVMARLGTALGWQHYTSGWHATCTSGAPAAAVGAGLALGLGAEGLARAISLALPAAGGVQRSFGTDTKSLQVGFAAEAGVRAARLAAHAARAPTPRPWTSGCRWSVAITTASARTPSKRRAKPYPAGWPRRSFRAATRCSGPSGPFGSCWPMHPSTRRTSYASSCTPPKQRCTR